MNGLNPQAQNFVPLNQRIAQVPEFVPLAQRQLVAPAYVPLAERLAEQRANRNEMNALLQEINNTRAASANDEREMNNLLVEINRTRGQGGKRKRTARRKHTQRKTRRRSQK